MKKSLMIIESPNKQQTIAKYLGGSGDSEITILATYGHIRELDENSYNGMGFEDHTYNVKWRNNVSGKDGKRDDVISKINKQAEVSDEILLSTDPDREGEAIAWHVYEILSKENQKKCKRIVFNEITKSALLAAMQNPRELDQNQINSYMARKLLDRRIGFKLSDFSRKSIGGMSAGRVQSIALKFLQDNQDEIDAFIPDHWFNIDLMMKNGLQLTLKKLSPVWEVELKEGSGDGVVNFALEEDANRVMESLDDYFILTDITDPKITKSSPLTPLKTSSMQRMAINKYGMPVSTVDKTAQTLYEGLQIDGEFISLITYPRTDRDDLSDTFVSSAMDWLNQNFSKEYVAGKEEKKAKKKASKQKELLVQGAHEAIRPTYVHITPKDLEGKIGKRELNLYKLVWSHAVASLMTAAQFENITYWFENQQNVFSVSSRREIFDGYLKLLRDYLGKEDGDDELSVMFQGLSKGDKYKSESKSVRRVDKKPPARYTESTLIKALEDKGIGRPSTYSNIVNIVLKREYAEKDKNSLVITPLGIKMSQALVKFFPNIMQYDYTKNMEEKLDDISEDRCNWKSFLDEVFLHFDDELLKAQHEVKSQVVGVCPECGGFLKNKFSNRTGRLFVGCDNFPGCKYIKKSSEERVEKEEPEKTGEMCPECGKELVYKISKKWKRQFIACPGFPKCTYIKRDQKEESPVEKIGRNCPQCGQELVKKMSRWKNPFISCSNFPKCRYFESMKGKKQDKQEDS